jgi:hypothetical protein
MKIETRITQVLSSLGMLLQEKNKRYGNSALAPIGIFNKTGAVNGITVRLDDKISRIKNATELRKNDVVDIMGYLTLLCVANEWTDFNDLID